ncbi:S1C family serine protease [Bradyrhizobium sp.]|jgi:S1-C subfamily serine protease|uniref:S1C family serine protease n=1 Tax=Bradyrhizobium sp. TaxID=376 RepID=UPI003C23EA5B
MKATISAVVATLCLVASSSSTSARGPYGSINLGNWHGGAYTDDNSGLFTHCAAGATYQSGIYFVVSVSGDFSWRLGFAHENWQLTPGQGFPLALTFDGQAAINVQGMPIGSHLVNVEMPANSALIAQFRKAKVMTAFAQSQLFQFSLNQTAQLLPSLANCVVSVKKNGIANAAEFAVSPPKQTAAKEVVATAAPPKPARTVEQTGTGFVVSNNGHVVTNQHVVDGCVGDIQGNLSGEAPIKLRLVSSDETNDLALLQAPSPFKEVATIRDKPIHPGDSVVAIGYPYHGLLTSDFTVTTGIVSSLSGILNDTRYLQISAAVQPGNSGGPLLDSGGVVVGMVAAKLNAIKFAKATGNIPENINFAIKTGALRDFLDNSVVGYQAADTRNELKTSDIARNARAFTLLISCTATEQNASAKKSDD